MWGHLRLILLVISGVYSQTSTNTNGASGASCAGKTCVTNAQCVGNECVCNPPFVWGEGDFSCYRRNQVATEVRNDPTLTNFQNVTVRFDYPCRYLVTQVKQQLKNSRNVIGFCDCTIHAWNSKNRGKFYVHGYDIACEVTNNNLNNTISFGVRKYGTSNNGNYTYFESGANSFAPDGPWPDPPVDIDQNGVRVKCDYDQVNNFAILNIRQCGLSVGLRGYDVADPRGQTQVPGIYVGVNCAHHPKFLQHDKVVALAPLNFGGVEIDDIRPVNVSRIGAVLIRAFSQGVVQNQPEGSMTCSTIKNSLDNCNTASELADVDQKCLWILQEPRFVRCLDAGNNSTAVLDLLETCMDFVCTVGKSCSDFVDAIEDTGCDTVTGIPILNDYISGSICL